MKMRVCVRTEEALPRLIPENLPRKDLLEVAMKSAADLQLTLIRTDCPPPFPMTHTVLLPSKAPDLERDLQPLLRGIVRSIFLQVRLPLNRPLSDHEEELIAKGADFAFRLTPELKEDDIIDMEGTQGFEASQVVLIALRKFWTVLKRHLG